MAATWRLIDHLSAGLPAPRQMAADEALVGEVAGGALPAVRLYRWRRPALSLGRFQPDADVDAGACAERGVEIVRRPTGGRALLHGGDLTYAAVFPAPPGAAGSVDAVYRWVAAGMVTGLARLGVRVEVAHHEGEASAACFASLRGSDLRAGGRKLVGSAQVRRDGVILQHGSVLLDRLSFDETDLLVGQPGQDRDAARAQLRAATVTLAELGAPADARTVASALVEGLAQTLDLDFTSRVSVAAGSGPQ